jgi:hypothetical protein
MPRTNFDSPVTPAAETLVEALFALGGVGYVGVGSGQEVLMRRLPAPALSGGARGDFYDALIDSTSESTFYEELLVNPTLVKLAGQRGRLDCGGLRYVAIGYGGFVQLVLPMKDGHLSLGVAETADVASLAAAAHEVLARPRPRARAAAPRPAGRCRPRKPGLRFSLKLAALRTGPRS